MSAGATGNGSGGDRGERPETGDGIDRRLEESFSALAAATVDAPPMSDELLRELDDLTPVRTRSPRRQTLTVLGLSLIYGGAILAVLGLRHDLEHVPPAWLVGVGALWMASFGWITWTVLVPPHEQVMPRWRWAAAISAAACALFIAGGLMRPESVAAAGPTYDVSLSTWFDHGNRCLRLGLTVALVPVALSAFAVRGAVPVGSRWAAAAIGAAGGSLGGFMLHMHCSVGERLHIGLAHGGVVIVAAGLAALVAPVGERVRRTSKPDSQAPDSKGPASTRPDSTPTSDHI